MVTGNNRIFDSNETTLREWQRYYDSLEAKGIYHDPEYIKTLERHYNHFAELFVFEVDNDNFVYYPYFRRNLAELPFADNCGYCNGEYFDIDSSWYYGGPLIRASQETNKSKLVKSFVGAFSKYCKESGIVSEFVRFDPNIMNHTYFEDIVPVTRNREAVYVVLTQPEESIWNNMEGRARTSIRKAKKQDVTVNISGNKSHILRFYEIYAAEMERKKAPDHYLFEPEYFIDIFKRLEGKIDLVYAEVNGSIISGGIFVHDNHNAAHYFLMATDYSYFQVQANSLILYEALKYYKGKGIRIFDFQGGRDGVFNFKKSFSKLRAPFFTSGIIHNKSVYDELVKYKEKEAGKIAQGYFPLYRINDTN